MQGVFHLGLHGWPQSTCGGRIPNAPPRVSSLRRRRAATPQSLCLVCRAWGGPGWHRRAGTARLWRSPVGTAPTRCLLLFILTSSGLWSLPTQRWPLTQIRWRHGRGIWSGCGEEPRGWGVIVGQRDWGVSFVFGCVICAWWFWYVGL
jgi:hypothetical protein